MTSTGIRFVASMFFCSLLLTGCGYRFAATAENRITPGQSLWVAFIANSSVSQTAQTVLRRVLYEECHAMRGLYPANSEASADFRLTGTLTSYGYTYMSYDAIDQVKEYRLTVAVDLQMYRLGEKNPVWKGTLQSYQDYPVMNDLALQRSAEEAAFAAASKKLAQKLLIAVEQSY